MGKTKAQQEKEERIAAAILARFNRHELRERPDIRDSIRVFEMGRPDLHRPEPAPGDKAPTKYSFEHRNLLIFLPGKIIIVGDSQTRILPFGGDTDGIVSNNGYGLHWFAGKLGEGYLAEKFPGCRRSVLAAIQQTFSRLFRG